jgi:hypothetical protein
VDTRERLTTPSGAQAHVAEVLARLGAVEAVRTAIAGSGAATREVVEQARSAAREQLAGVRQAAR